ncbi:Scn11a [Symbiodinium natans]|uniref:Scn11a protein n=1 Tax=Symbiodinium natans TaxID=878477 RepID=A0A812PAE5_9DINO|nr:Scn11a [Symbiodinium natans]
MTALLALAEGHRRQILELAEAQEKAWVEALKSEGTTNAVVREEFPGPNLGAPAPSLGHIRCTREPIVAEYEDPLPQDVHDNLNSIVPEWRDSDDERSSNCEVVHNRISKQSRLSNHSRQEFGHLLDDDHHLDFTCLQVKSIKSGIELIAGVLVLLNSITLMVELEVEGRVVGSTIGLGGEGDENLASALPVFRIADAIFVGFFALELLVRIYLERRSFLHDYLNWWDALLVSAGLVDVILSIVQADSWIDNAVVRVARGLKALRAFRMMRSFRLFRGLRVLVKACQCPLVLIGRIYSQGQMGGGKSLTRQLPHPHIRFA